MCSEVDIHQGGEDAVVWRSVVVSSPAKLRREHFSLVVEQEQAARVPFEDIAVIVLNHREITLTHPVLSACGEYGIGLFSTGDDHQPNGVFMPFLQHSRATRMLRLQLGLDRPKTKRAWAEIVKRKIANQAACLRLAGSDSTERLESLGRRVRSGDAGNLEAQAAALYFSKLMGKGFGLPHDFRTLRVSAKMSWEVWDGKEGIHSGVSSGGGSARPAAWGSAGAGGARLGAAPERVARLVS